MSAASRLHSAIPLASSFIAIACSSQVGSYFNDSTSRKRDFYEDDNEVVPLPGSVVPASSSELKALGPNSIVEGSALRSPEVLQSNIKTARLKAHETYESLKKEYNQALEKYYTTEREVTSTISSLHERREDLLPNSIFVLVGALTGSIVSRRRNIAIRAVTPVLFGLAAFKWFLPETFEKTRAFAWKVEKKQLPALSEQQQAAYVKAEKLATDLETSYFSLKVKANSSIASTNKAIAEYTALNTERDVTKKK